MLLSNSKTYEITSSPPVSKNDVTAVQDNPTVLGVTRVDVGSGAKIGTESVSTL
jgi:hypothetical protein